MNLTRITRCIWFVGKRHYYTCVKNNYPVPTPVFNIGSISKIANVCLKQKRTWIRTHTHTTSLDDIARIFWERKSECWLALSFHMFQQNLRSTHDDSKMILSGTRVSNFIYMNVFFGIFMFISAEIKQTSNKTVD